MGDCVAVNFGLLCLVTPKKPCAIRSSHSFWWIFIYCTFVLDLYGWSDKLIGPSTVSLVRPACIKDKRVYNPWVRTVNWKILMCPSFVKWEGCVWGTRCLGIDSRWCDWNVSLIWSFRPHYSPGVDSASNRNKYEEYFLEVKTAVA
jgi:hypothetical protein